MTAPFKAYRTASGRSIGAILRDYGSRAESALGRQLYREGTGIMEASRPLVPVDTNALRSSGYVAEPVREGNMITVALGYGGPAAQINRKTGESTDGYALHVHEDLEAFHKVGGAKFLELPFNQATSGMGKRVAAGMRDDLNGIGSFYGEADTSAHGGVETMGDPEA